MHRAFLTLKAGTKGLEQEVLSFLNVPCDDLGRAGDPGAGCTL